MKAKEFDQKFDEDKEDMMEDLDLTQIKKPNHQQKRVNVDFPLWMVDLLDKEASRIGVTRQSIIKVWLAERLSQKEYKA